MANDSSVYMDTEYVLQMSQRFGQISNICNTIVTIVNTIQQILRASAFIGMIGNSAAASTLEPFKKGVTVLGEKLGEVGRDVRSAHDMFVNGDTKGSHRFC